MLITCQLHRGWPYGHVTGAFAGKDYLCEALIVYVHP